MAVEIDYYFAPQSPWAYLGHDRFVAMARAAGARVTVRPANYGAIFPASGGLPLGKRAPQRQAYRLVELRRFSQHLDVPLHLQPTYFPVSGDDAGRLIATVDAHDGTDAALAVAGAVFRAVWAEQRNIADGDVLSQLLAEQGLAAERLAQSREAPAQAAYAAHTQAAIEAGVFGAPSYVLQGEIFWGQDRLDFLQRQLNRLS